MILLIALNYWNFSWLLPYNLNFFLVAGTNNDDDLPPPSPNGSDMRVHGHVSDDGRAIVPASSYARAHIDMDAQVHHLELGLLHTCYLVMLSFGFWL